MLEINNQMYFEPTLNIIHKGITKLNVEWLFWGF